MHEQKPSRLVIINIILLASDPALRRVKCSTSHHVLTAASGAEQEQQRRHHEAGSSDDERHCVLARHGCRRPSPVRSLCTAVCRRSRQQWGAVICVVALARLKEQLEQRCGSAGPCMDLQSVGGNSKSRAAQRKEAKGIDRQRWRCWMMLNNCSCMLSLSAFAFRRKRRGGTRQDCTLRRLLHERTGIGQWPWRIEGE
jgi:hypothetical protein